MLIGYEASLQPAAAAAAEQTPVPTLCLLGVQ